MKSSDKKVIVALLRVFPLVFAAVALQCLGSIALGFLIFAAFPEQRWLADAVALPYWCWSSWCLWKQGTKLSERYYRP